MNKKKISIFIILFLIIIIAIGMYFLVKNDIDPVSYVVGNKENHQTKQLSNKNGIYNYRENLNGNFELFSGCTISYYDYYILILNENYYRYKSSCIGTFLLEEGNTKDLILKESLENNKYIEFESHKYYKKESIKSIKSINNFKKDKGNGYQNLKNDSYQIVLKEIIKPSQEQTIKTKISFTNTTYDFSFKTTKYNQYTLDLAMSKEVFYSYTNDDLNKLPKLFNFSKNLVIVEPIEYKNIYKYSLKMYSESKLRYDLKDQFPITVDDVQLDYNDNIYIKGYHYSKKLTVLISKEEKFCEDNNQSSDIAYYVFDINYNHSIKNLDKPKFIKKVYKNEGCKYFNSLLED